MNIVPKTIKASVVLITIVVCKDKRFLALFTNVVKTSEMTIKPRPPIINNAAAVSGIPVELEKRLMFSEKLEKPALQKADTA